MPKQPLTPIPSNNSSRQSTFYYPEEIKLILGLRQMGPEDREFILALSEGIAARSTHKRPALHLVTQVDE
jgi:hypothetical protein